MTTEPGGVAGDISTLTKSSDGREVTEPPLLDGEGSRRRDRVLGGREAAFAKPGTGGDLGTPICPTTGAAGPSSAEGAGGGCGGRAGVSSLSAIAGERIAVLKLASSETAR
jgi:hypothetical protein